MKYPEKYLYWRGHALRYSIPYIDRYPLWKNLKPDDELKVWHYIEDHYLEKYRMFFQVDVDWGSTGLWEIQTPGSTGTLACYPNDYLGSPPQVVKDLTEWVQGYDENAQPWKSDDAFDYDEFAQNGLEIAKKIKLYAPKDIYLQFHVFQEIVVIDDGVIELDVPLFIQNLTGFRSLQSYHLEHPDPE
jgi:hypothetical protein